MDDDKRTVQVSRAPQGETLTPEVLEEVRRLLAEHGSVRSLAASLEVTEGAVARAAAGAPILKGTRALILAGLERLRADGGGRR